MTLPSRSAIHAWWAIPAATALLVSGCSGDADGDLDPTAGTTQSAPAPDTSATSQTDADIDVDSSGDPTTGAQDSEGTASLGTAVATLTVPLPGQWQYEGTYGDGARPYAVLADASQPFDLSQPGSDAYRDSVWVQVETYGLGEPSPYGGEMPEDPETVASQLTTGTGADASTTEVGGVTVVYGTYTENGSTVEDLWVRKGDVWILARASNVDVDAYLNGESGDGILNAILEGSEVK